MYKNQREHAIDSLQLLPSYPQKAADASPLYQIAETEAKNGFFGLSTRCIPEATTKKIRMGLMHTSTTTISSYNHENKITTCNRLMRNIHHASNLMTSIHHVYILM
ncbi:hypothetical protein L484_001875 [Morus notabilis]|uniref:Uncharacterized protein n=1 Tax=Morus notabilis TaxID=981085 RepID=W9QTP7_9ROSA|nr:hypothetical protein L484_001875 [Morus notabilis]